MNIKPFLKAVEVGANLVIIATGCSALYKNFSESDDDDGDNPIDEDADEEGEDQD